MTRAAADNKVIVIGCGTAGLAVIRALGRRKGISTIALTHSRQEIAWASKYVSEVFDIPHPGTQEKQFIEFLMQKADRWKGALLFDTGDYIAVALSKHKHRLAGPYRIITPEWEILRRFIDKQETYAVADRCGVPHPTTFLPQTLQEVTERSGQLQYPCLLKPLYSHEFVNKFHTKNFEVLTEAALLERFRQCLHARQPVLIQEIIPGAETNLERLQTYVNTKGQMSAKFFHRKVRQHPPGFGVMRVGVSTGRNREVEVLSERLLCCSGYRGYCSIEFKRDPRDNRLKLIEVNARMPRSGRLAVASGINFPWIIYLDLVRNQQIEIRDYKEGVYLIELLPDLFNTLFRHRQENFSLRDYLRPYLARNKAFAVFDIHDPKPFLKQAQQLFSIFPDRLARLRSRFKTQPAGPGAGEEIADEPAATRVADDRRNHGATAPLLTTCASEYSGPGNLRSTTRS